VAWTSQLATTALLTLAELNAAVGEDPQAGDHRPHDDRKEAIINALSLQVENEILDRHLVSRGSLTEYHSPAPEQDVIFLHQWPGLTLTSVHEDPSAASLAVASRYAASTLLTENTDFEKEYPSGPDGYAKLVRIGAYWATGRKTIKVVYTAGYSNTAAIPKDVKQIVLEVCRRTWLLERGGRGDAVQSFTDASGTSAFVLPALLTAKDKERLRPYQRRGRSTREAA
jgi:hypothetical protein